MSCCVILKSTSWRWTATGWQLRSWPVPTSRISSWCSSNCPKTKEHIANFLLATTYSRAFFQYLPLTAAKHANCQSLLIYKPKTNTCPNDEMIDFQDSQYVFCFQGPQKESWWIPKANRGITRSDIKSLLTKHNLTFCQEFGGWPKNVMKEPPKLRKLWKKPRDQLAVKINCKILASLFIYIPSSSWDLGSRITFTAKPSRKRLSLWENDIKRMIIKIRNRSQI